jgi:type II secretory pathway pseudopilin PulG
MKKKYNQGTTIIEVLISIILISVIISLLFGLLIQIQKDDDENNLNASFMLAQSSMIKAVEEDSINYTIKRVSSCTLQEAGIKDDTIASNKYECIRIEYDKNQTKDNIGYLTVYEYYKTYGSTYCPNGELRCNSTWVARYTRGNYKDCLSGSLASENVYTPVKTIMKEYLSGVNIDKIRVSYGTDYDSTLNISNQIENPVSISLPISAYNGRHYDINLSFNHKIYSSIDVSQNFICDNTSLSCTCFGLNCSLTYPSGDLLDEENKYKFTC